TAEVSRVLINGSAVEWASADDLGLYGENIDAARCVDGSLPEEIRQRTRGRECCTVVRRSCDEPGCRTGSPEHVDIPGAIERELIGVSGQAGRHVRNVSDVFWVRERRPAVGGADIIDVRLRTIRWGDGIIRPNNIEITAGVDRHERFLGTT